MCVQGYGCPEGTMVVRHKAPINTEFWETPIFKELEDPT